MQYKVPQNVRRADTIIGPITLAQLGILLVGGGFAYAFYMMLAKTYYWYVWIWPVGITAALTLAIAFLKISDMSFTKFILYFYEFLTKPKERVWRKGDSEYYQSALKSPINIGPESVSQKTYEEEQIMKKKKIEELSNILDK